MKMVALLRGINVGGNKKVPMAELCKLAGGIGLMDVRHYINSGNLVFEAGKFKAEKVASMMEAAIEDHFGFQVCVLVRTYTQWKKYSAGSPFPSAAKERPHLLQLGLSKESCSKSAASLLNEKAVHGEKIKISGDAIWIDFVGGVGKSKLTPAILDKAAGSSVTLRNWNTVLKIEEMLG